MKQFKLNPLLLQYVTETCSLLLGMSGILFLQFLQAFPPIPVYSCFTLDHTQLISLHSVLKRAILVITGGAHFGQVPI